MNIVLSLILNTRRGRCYRSRNEVAKSTDMFYVDEAWSMCKFPQQRVTTRRKIFDSVPNPDCPKKKVGCTEWKEWMQSRTEKYTLCELVEWLSSSSLSPLSSVIEARVSRLPWFNSLVNTLHKTIRFCKLDLLVVPFLQYQEPLPSRRATPYWPIWLITMSALGRRSFCVDPKRILIE